MKASWNGVDFFVEDMDNLRITRVLVQIPRPLQQDHEEIVDMSGEENTETKPAEEAPL